MSAAVAPDGAGGSGASCVPVAAPVGAGRGRVDHPGGSFPGAVSAAYTALGAIGSAGGREMPRTGQSQQENADG